jgi:hypothetical protein
MLSASLCVDFAQNFAVPKVAKLDFFYLLAVVVLTDEELLNGYVVFDFLIQVTLDPLLQNAALVLGH